MSFQTPYLPILGIVGLIFWLMSYFKLGRKAQLYASTKYGLNIKINILRSVICLLGIISWLLITFSLSTPREPIGSAENDIEVNDIFFIVDVSRSMLAEDFAPNRLEAAKLKILEFVKLRPKDRIGIVMFSEKAFTLLPLSTDLKLIEEMVKEIKIGFLGAGTNIGDAIGLAVGRATQSLAKNKVFILLTDGVSIMGSMTPVQAAKEAKKESIKIYTIAIGGAEDGNVLPQGKSLFGKKRYAKLPGGSIDTEVLKEIADITNGRHFVAADNQALTNVLNEIEKLERTKVKSSGRVIYKELYFQYLLFGVIGLFLIELARKLVLRESL